MLWFYAYMYVRAGNQLGTATVARSTTSTDTNCITNAVAQAPQSGHVPLFFLQQPTDVQSLLKRASERAKGHESRHYRPGWCGHSPSAMPQSVSSVSRPPPKHGRARFQACVWTRMYIPCCACLSCVSSSSPTVLQASPATSISSTCRSISGMRKTSHLHNAYIHASNH